MQWRTSHRTELDAITRNYSEQILTKYKANFLMSRAVHGHHGLPRDTVSSQHQKQEAWGSWVLGSEEIQA